mmetsp:Transcript_36080/g.37451  ORF Transcript_36080/g.37451 Transcript_36080/m.37451 type:complete len:210 (-) Transcript_36080:8-637(-)
MKIILLPVILIIHSSKVISPGRVKIISRVSSIATIAIRTYDVVYGVNVIDVVSHKVVKMRVLVCLWEVVVHVSVCIRLIHVHVVIQILLCTIVRVVIFKHIISFDISISSSQIAGVVVYARREVVNIIEVCEVNIWNSTANIHIFVIVFISIEVVVLLFFLFLFLLFFFLLIAFLFNRAFCIFFSFHFFIVITLIVTLRVTLVSLNIIR